MQDRTVQSYLGWVKQLAAHYPDEHIPSLKSGKVLDFLLHLKLDRKLKGSTIKQAVVALRTLYRDDLGHKWKIWSKVKFSCEAPLPAVLTREEVARLLGTFRDGRYRAFFTLLYQCGFRLSEALSIRPKDIDGQRLVIRIVKGKNGKSREVPISPELLARLRKFWAFHKNPNWLFPGVGRGWKSSGISISDAMHRSKHHMTKSCVWSAINIAGIECGLHKTHDKVSCHTLRHSYATHMLEAGVTVRQVADYLGHTTLKPTMVYLHLTAVSEEQARAALRTLAGS